jgi:hypothetical protein
LYCRIKRGSLKKKQDVMQLVEVFKTDMDCAEKARQLVEQIHNNFTNCKANFDLEDCDRILRIVINNSNLETNHFINWLKDVGCTAQILPGE